MPAQPISVKGEAVRPTGLSRSRIYELMTSGDPLCEGRELGADSGRKSSRVHQRVSVTAARR
jgi:predicted DNA-binding transcriptional regulator AlpA